VIVKLSAIVGDVGKTAKAAIAAGAVGITVTNTIGPATVNLGGTPILSNKVGGLSGSAIRPLGLRAVKRVRDAIGEGPVIIGMGGISRPEDIRDFQNAGADLFGIGSALTGMDSGRMKHYFHELETAAASPTPQCPAPQLEALSMDYSPARIVGREEYHPGMFKITLDHLPIQGEEGGLGGKYFFLFVPGTGEKPFAIFCAQEKSIVIRVAGRFTKALSELPVGAPVYLRGPYGRQFPRLENRQMALVGGGTGIASLLEIGRRLHGKNELHFLLGGRTGKDLFDLPKFSEVGSVKVATNDGSEGHRGFVSDLLKEWIEQKHARSTYVLCGPEPMVEAGFKLLKDQAESSQIWAAIEYMTSCGVGICGKCASPSGLLTCIDGPFMQYPNFHRGFGQCSNGGCSSPTILTEKKR
jgi:dihydroorotate dehydrogenase (NAD+) catalytic subunit